MRAIFVVGLCLLMAMPAARATPTRDFQADEGAVRACVDAAMKADFDRALGRQPDGPKPLFTDCIGKEETRCLETTEHDDYESFRRSICAAAEAQVWSSLLESAYAALRTHSAECDRKRCTVFPGTSEYEPVEPALEQLHEAWLAAKARHCELVRIQAGSGTARIDAPVRCARDEDAERTYLYLQWLRWGIH
jgi:uncharacterized protein YecT (DUF1311 family)